MNALQRARVASQLTGIVKELLYTKEPMPRARLAKTALDLIKQMGSAGVSNEQVQVLREIAEGRKDDLALDVLWSLIYQAASDLQENELLSGDAETLTQDAITHWAELEEKTDV
nr:hypothetical protein [uncultured Rhodoferax sp.]